MENVNDALQTLYILIACSEAGDGQTRLPPWAYITGVAVNPVLSLCPQLYATT